MLKVFFISISILFVGILSAIGQQEYSNEEYALIQKESVRPKGKFKFRKSRFVRRIDFEKVDTNAVYVTQFSDSSFVFLRFFKGVVFESGPYLSSPTGEELEDLSYGVWRCYTMNKKGLLVIQQPKRFQMDGWWIYFLGTISPDRFEMTHYFMEFPPIGTSPGFLQEPRIYFKQSVNFVNRSYQW